jgi:hypothetical protein
MAINFISNALVKLNNDYTYIKTIAPANTDKAPAYLNGQTWLTMSTGYSYELTDDNAGTWTQIEQDKDFRITAQKNGVVNTVFQYINNRFYIPRQINYSDVYDTAPSFVFNRKRLFTLYTYESVFAEFSFSMTTKKATLTGLVYGALLDSFQIGDMIYIQGSTRNDGYYTIKTVTDTVIEINETFITETANCFVVLSSVPPALLQIISKMIYFDVYVRLKIGGLQSERIGTYSYSTQALDGGLGYPRDITSGLDMYVLTDAGGVSNFVD